MAKLIYPSATATYRGIALRARMVFDELYSHIKSSPDSAAVVAAQLAPLAVAAGYTTPIPSTSKQIASGVKVTMPEATGVYADGYTFTIVAGEITAAVAS